MHHHHTSPSKRVHTAGLEGIELTRILHRLGLGEHRRPSTEEVIKTLTSWLVRQGLSVKPLLLEISYISPNLMLIRYAEQTE